MLLKIYNNDNKIVTGSLIYFVKAIINNIRYYLLTTIKCCFEIIALNLEALFFTHYNCINH